MTRNPLLDGLRGIAIAQVLIWHYLGCQILPTFTPSLLWLRQSVSLMWSGVDLFFVLSGFLITGILRDQKGSPHYWRTFYLRRACRILPLYLLLFTGYAAALALDAGLLPKLSWLFANPMPLFSYATFTQNIFMGLAHGTGANWMGVSWSLAVEEQFYLILPLLVYSLSTRRLALVLAAAVILAPALRAAFPGYAALINAPFKADPLCLGGLIALLVREPALIAKVSRHITKLQALFVILLLAAAGMTFRVGPFSGLDLQLGPFSAISLLLLSLLYSVMLLLVLLKPEAWYVRPLASRLLQWLGAVSYATYLFHQLISGALHALLRGSIPVLESGSAAAVTLLALVLTLLLAEISRRFFEGPILRWGHRFSYC